MKLIILIFTLSASLYACATCMLMQPLTEVSMVLHSDKNRLYSIHYKWVFPELYSSELLIQFDKNGNNQFDPDELHQIETIKINYLQPRAMLTTITYTYDDNTSMQTITSHFANFKLEYINNRLVFSYDGAIGLMLEPQSILQFEFSDEAGFFAFLLQDLTYDDLPFHVESNLYTYVATLSFENPPTEVPVTPKRAKTISTSETPPKSYLAQSVDTIKALLQRIKNEHSVAALSLLLLFSYIYGFVHALGPGHGKTLVGSYFFGNDRSIAKAFLIATSIGVVHTFSALLLTAIVYFVMHELLSTLLDDVVKATTFIAAIIIIAIALWLLMKKVRYYLNQRAQKSAALFQSATVTTIRANTAHIDACGCQACAVDAKSTDIALILSAGIVPCPGTVTLFIFAFSIGLYSVGIFAAFMMSFGMSSVIFISAAMSTLLKKQLSSRLNHLKPMFEILSLGVILLLGIVLLLL